MGNFILEYRDPIFGLIILISVILLISVLSYFWGIFSKKEEKESIEKFIKKFQTANSLSAEHQELLRNLNINAETLGILASTFVRSGDFEKAISVYIIALNKATSKKEREFLLTNLGKVYFKAGFMERAKIVLLQAIEISPRNPEALQILSVIYEKLKLYKEALEVLDALNEQNVDTFGIVNYINALIIKNDTSLKFEEKISQILNLKLNFASRLALEMYIQNREPLENFKNFPPLRECIDLIFPLNQPVNLQDSEYNALFYAKGMSENEQKSEIFEINLLSALKNQNFNSATLKFSYVCEKCKNELPMFFYRCPVCYSLQSVHIIPKIVEKSDDFGQTF